MLMILDTRNPQPSLDACPRQVRFESFVKCLPSNVCRAKGLLWGKGLARRIIFHYSGRRTNPLEFEGASAAAAVTPLSTKILFIGRDLPKEWLQVSLDGLLCDED